MKTIEELEAELETVTRERDLSLFAWESAGMQGRDAQSAMLELARQLEEACAEIATLTAALDERDVEAERSLEQYDRLVRENATLHAMLDGRMPDTWREDIETLTHQLADATNETTRARLEAKREAEALTDERDELLVRVAQQEAELRATREAYRVAYRRGAEAMREACAQVDPYELHRSNASFARSVDSPASVVRIMQEGIRALPIPEEP